MRRHVKLFVARLFGGALEEETIPIYKPKGKPGRDIHAALLDARWNDAVAIARDPAASSSDQADPRLHYCAGIALEMVGEPAAAEKRYSRALSRSSNSPDEIAFRRDCRDAYERAVQARNELWVVRIDRTDHEEPDDGEGSMATDETAQHTTRDHRVNAGRNSTPTQHGTFR
ncbi:hypothetical protein RAS1_14950 [Phycisphaerae bacterium RAS1]|nr:hypothetical protein RAS1_14950 [Phycisphaerae bacterium RAS1]